MEDMNLDDIHNQIQEMKVHADLAVEAAKGSAAVAYQASVENVRVIKEMHETIKDMSEDVKENLVQSTRTNGRVTNLEKWSDDARKIIEVNSKAISTYTTDKKIAIAAYILIAVLGGTIITLAIMAIDSKIKDGINEALLNYK